MRLWGTFLFKPAHTPRWRSAVNECWEKENELFPTEINSCTKCLKSCVYVYYVCMSMWTCVYIYSVCYNDYYEYGIWDIVRIYGSGWGASRQYLY